MYILNERKLHVNQSRHSINRSKIKAVNGWIRGLNVSRDVSSGRWRTEGRSSRDSEFPFSRLTACVLRRMTVGGGGGVIIESLTNEQLTSSTRRGPDSAGRCAQPSQFAGPENSVLCCIADSLVAILWPPPSVRPVRRDKIARALLAQPEQPVRRLTLLNINKPVSSCTAGRSVRSNATIPGTSRK